MSELPQGWTTCQLRECAEVLDNLRVPVNSDERAKRQGSVPYYGATCQVGWIDDYLFDEELLLIGEDGAPFFDKSKPIAYLIKGKSWVNNHAHVLRAKAEVTSNLYLKWFLDNFDFNGYVNGTTRLKLTQGSMNEIPVSLPPLNEQRRIVAKLEELLARVDASQQRLAKIPVILKRFRQAVLAAACSGRLTADWREENSKAPSPGAPRHPLPEGEGKLLPADVHPLHEGEGRGEGEELPDGWCVSQIANVCESLKYGTSQKCSPDKKGVPVLRIPNIAKNIIDHDDIKYADLPTKEFQQLRLQPGDVLVIRSNGSVSLVGKSALVREAEKDFAYAGYLIRIRPDLAKVQPEYLNLVLGSYEVRLQIEVQPAPQVASTTSIVRSCEH